MAVLNEKINWIPAYIKSGRFGQTIETCPDWSISRNRYWASPLPVWKCDTCNEIEFIGSVGELKSKLKKRNNYFLNVKKTELAYIFGFYNKSDFYDKRNLGNIYKVSEYINYNYHDTKFLNIWNILEKN